MRQYLAEGVTGAFPFFVDRTKPLVSESRPSGLKVTRIPGRLSICDCVNGNGRRYSKHVWEKNLTNGSPLMEAIERNAAFGLLEHPKDGIVTLLSPISHVVTEAKLIESKDEVGKSIWEVVGEISLVETPEGDKLKALIEAGYNPLVSSRGYGSLSKSADGIDDVQDDYVCESWDVVIKPSFEQAELKPVREPAASAPNARMAAPVAPNPTAESKEPAKEVALTEAKTDLKESPSTGPAAAAASPTKTNRIKSMELNEIKGRVTALRAVEPSKLDPQRFAESVTLIEELHQETAKWAAGDATRAWDAQKTHRELDQMASSFNEAAAAPTRQARKLTENNTKLMRVVNAVAQTAITYKKKLGESLQAGTKAQKMVEELTKRGQGWRQIAEDRKGKLQLIEKQFDTSTEALDLMAARYHEDTTELGRRLLQLEFKDKLATNEALTKKLKEATRLRHVAAIREELEGKKPVVEGDKGPAATPKEGEAPSKEAIKDEKQKGAPSPEEGKVAKEPGKVTNESKEDKKAAPVTEDKKDSAAKPVTETKVIYSSSFTAPGLNESVEMVRRMSGAAAK